MYPDLWSSPPGRSFVECGYRRADDHYRNAGRNSLDEDGFQQTPSRRVSPFAAAPSAFRRRRSLRRSGDPFYRLAFLSRWALRILSIRGEPKILPRQLAIVTWSMDHER